MSKIVLSHIDKFYGENHVLRDINLTIEDGDFMTLLGPSGCRESSPAAPLLMMLGCCGLMRGFAEGIRNAPQISPAGFAAGMFLSYGFDCLAG